MKWIFWGIWCILCIVGIILNMIVYCLAWVVMQLWGFKYHKFTWNYWTETEEIFSSKSGWRYSWVSKEHTPLDTYKQWINFDIL